jgi:hypothetical protein
MVKKLISPPEVDLFISKIQFYSNFKMVPHHGKGLEKGDIMRKILGRLMRWNP